MVVRSSRNAVRVATAAAVVALLWNAAAAQAADPRAGMRRAKEHCVKLMAKAAALAANRDPETMRHAALVSNEGKWDGSPGTSCWEVVRMADNNGTDDPHITSGNVGRWTAYAESELALAQQAAKASGKGGKKPAPAPATAPPPPNDAQLFARVLSLCKQQNQIAVGKLRGLLTLAAGSGPLTPADLNVHRIELGAVQDRLHVAFGGPRFAQIVGQAVADLQANWAELGRVPLERAQASSGCHDGDWACTPNGGPVRLTIKWFGANAQCQIDVVAHEMVHARGHMTHAFEVTGKNDHKLFTPDEAVGDPNEMAQLVGLLATGSADHCP
jgi:hypothetical protein